MNTTKLAKIFVVLNTAMAFAFLMWSIALKTQRIDWFTPKEASAGEKVVGQIDTLANDIKVANAAHNANYNVWLNAKQNLDVQEKDRPQRRDFYRDQLVMARTGQYKGQPVNTPFQQFENANNGSLLIAKPTGRPAINYKPNDPLRSIAEYEKATTERIEMIRVIETEIGKLLVDLNAESALIQGTDAQKGLRVLIREQEAILNAAREENEYLGTAYANLIAETTLFTKRLDAIKARQEELTKAGAKTQVGLGQR